MVSAPRLLLNHLLLTAGVWRGKEGLIMGVTEGENAARNRSVGFIAYDQKTRTFSKFVSLRGLELVKRCDFCREVMERPLVSSGG